MNIRDLFSRKNRTISFEIFPPMKNSPIDTIYKTIEELKDLNPDFMSVTYGAGGNGGDSTLEIASILKNKYGIETIAHLTCVTSHREEINSKLESLKANNIENILALRGDIPECFEFNESNHYKYAKDLIKQIKEYGGFGIGAAAYPEGHIDCEDLNTSIKHLKEKVDAGADFLITQLFFDNNLFYDFMDLAGKYSIDVPVLAGLMPILSRKQIEKMVFMCGVSLPSKIIKIVNRYEKDPEGLKKAGIEYVVRQMDDLISNSVRGIHVYAMNKPEVVREIMKSFEFKREVS